MYCSLPEVSIIKNMTTLWLYVKKSCFKYFHWKQQDHSWIKMAKYGIWIWFEVRTEAKNVYVHGWHWDLLKMWKGKDTAQPSS